MGCFCARTVSRGQFVGGVELHFGDGFRPVGAAAKASGHAFFKIFPSDHHLPVGSGLEVVLQADALGKGLRGIAIDNRRPARNNCINKRLKEQTPEMFACEYDFGGLRIYFLKSQDKNQID